MKRTICFLVTVIGIAVFGTWKGNAFALLGPVEPWMQPTNGLAMPGDIGGPMCISNQYRWNVPVVTYGFDKSFVSFFGTNGVAAVESAVQILNNLPPASQIAFTNYPFNSVSENLTAESQNLIDLKSWALPLLLEHMGLADPVRYIFVLKQWNPVFTEYSTPYDWPDWVYPDYISERNFDPQTLAPSQNVNITQYTAEISIYGDRNIISPISVDPNADTYTAVADYNDGGSGSAFSGAFYTGLTYDDVGGLRYLLSTNTIAYESLLPGVTGVGTNANSFVNGAWRPGVDKITFIPQPMDCSSGTFQPMTNYYTDTYITNGVWMQQQLARVITKPDFLFCASDLKYNVAAFPIADRTGTTNWVNNAAHNGNPGGDGPGVIQPPVKIEFEKIGAWYEGSGSSVQPYFFQQYWSSFDGSTNPPVVYPIPQSGTNQLTVRLWFSSTTENLQKSFDWKPCSLWGTQYAMQTSPDLVNWTTLFTVTNNGSVCTFVDGPSGTSQFFRLLPQ